jgi:quercetin dioxygenase-like cupin family protein
MNSKQQQFREPQNFEEVCELAHVYATEGLSDEHALKAWLGKASEEEQALFASEVDAVSMLTMVMVPGQEAPSLNLEAITSSTTKDFPPGFFYQGGAEGEWRELPVKGARVKELSNTPEDGFTVMMLEMDPGARFPSHYHHGSEQVYLLDGDLFSDREELSPGDFLRAAADTHHGGLYSEFGCHALIIMAQQNYPSKAVHLDDRVAKTARRMKKKVFG